MQPWLVVTDVSGKPIGPIFKSQAVQVLGLPFYWNGINRLFCPSSSNAWFLKMGSMGCPEMSVTHCQSRMHNIAEHHSKNLKSCTSNQLLGLKLNCPVLTTVKVFIYQLMHKRVVLKRISKFTLKQLLRVSVQSPSSGSALIWAC